MNRTPLKNIVLKQVKRLIKQLRFAKHDFSLAEIHAFRVKYKKLRSFLKCISDLSGNIYDNSDLKKINKIYKLLGAIRDIQLQQQRILEISTSDRWIPLEYIKYLQEKIKTLIVKFNQISIERSVKDLRRYIHDIHLNKISSKQIELYFENAFKDGIRIENYDNIRDKDIHKLRSIGKDLANNLSVLSKNRWLKSSQILYLAERKKIPFVTLLEEMGDFQDRCLAINFLDESHLTSLTKSNRDILIKYRLFWLRDKAKLKADILKHIRKGRITFLPITFITKVVKPPSPKEYK